MNEVLNSEFARSEARNEPWGEAAEGSPLRPVLWSELTARLAAMRDLRRTLSETAQAGGANFSSLAAAGSHPLGVFTNLADSCEEPQHPSSQVKAATQDINPKALADRKGPVPKSSNEPNCVTPGDRELK